eukprot:2975294-Amphidinium_carterae.2
MTKVSKVVKSTNKWDSRKSTLSSSFCTTACQIIMPHAHARDSEKTSVHRGCALSWTMWMLEV